MRRVPLCSLSTRQGVLALAASFVGALGILFPSSIDRLPPDAGVFAGPRPLVVPGGMSPSALVRDMLSQGASFGARQVSADALSESACARRAASAEGGG